MVKGWKKSSVTKNKIVWQGIDGDRATVVKSPLGGWYFGANGLLHVKVLKTKQQGIASAKKYMKARPRG